MFWVFPHPNGRQVADERVGIGLTELSYFGSVIVIHSPEHLVLGLDDFFDSSARANIKRLHGAKL